MLKSFQTTKRDTDRSYGVYWVPFAHKSAHICCRSGRHGTRHTVVGLTAGWQTHPLAFLHGALWRGAGRVHKYLALGLGIEQTL